MGEIILVFKFSIITFIFRMEKRKRGQKKNLFSLVEVTNQEFGLCITTIK